MLVEVDIVNQTTLKLLTFKELDLFIITIVRNNYITNQIVYPSTDKLKNIQGLKNLFDLFIKKYNEHGCVNKKIVYVDGN